MYIAITNSSSSSAILRASSKVRFSTSLQPKPCFVKASLLSSPFRSVSTSSAFRSVSRWSHGVDWRSSVTSRAQIVAVAPVVQQFQRKIATMGIYLCLSTAEYPFLITFLFRICQIKSIRGFDFTSLDFDFISLISQYCIFINLIIVNRWPTTYAKLVMLLGLDLYSTFHVLSFCSY